MAKVTVNRQACSSLGECEAVAPLVFEVQADAPVKVLVEGVPADELDSVRSAVFNCPMSALTLSE